jgi:hypothetical protein
VSLPGAATTLPFAPGADAFDDEFGVGGFVAVGQGDVGYGDVREAYGALAYGAGEMNMTRVMIMDMVGMCGKAILLHTRTIVYGTQYAALGKEREGTENRGVVGRNHLLHHVLKREGTSVHALADGLEHQQAHGRYAYSGFGKKSLVSVMCGCIGDRHL